MSLSREPAPAGVGTAWLDALPSAWRVDPVDWAGARGWRAAPRAVLRPPDAAAVAEVFRRASAGGAPARSLVVAGGGRQLARWPLGGGLYVLDVSALRGPIELDAGNLTCVAPAATSWAELAEGLAGTGLDYPIQGPGDEASTVGGHVCANTANHRRYRYGTARDWVLGVEWVTPGGQVIRVGGPMVKNVAGYDLTKLMVGSRGRLGVASRIILRLRPAPLARCYGLARAARLADLWPTVQTLTRLPGGPVGMTAWSVWGEPPVGRDGMPALTGPGVAARFEYHGSEPELAAERTRFEEALARGGIAGCEWQGRGKGDPAESHSGSYGPEGLLSGSQAGAVAVLLVPRGRLLELWEAAREVYAGSPPVVAQAELGSGVLRLAGPPPPREGWARLRSAAEGLGGYADWEVPPSEEGYPSSENPAGAWEEAVRQVFDPAGILWDPARSRRTAGLAGGSD